MIKAVKRDDGVQCEVTGEAKVVADEVHAVVKALMMRKETRAMLIAAVLVCWPEAEEEE